jgi:uncharacterized protein (DUF1330 family)
MEALMKKGYWIAMVDVTDPENYKRYIAANAEAFARYGAKFIVRGGPYQSPEGPTGTRHAVIEFESYEKALACYNSPEYQEALKLRRQSSTGHLAIVEGA